MNETGNQGMGMPKLNLNFDFEQLKESVVNFIIPIICVVVSIVLLLTVLYPSIKERPGLQAELTKAQTLRSNLQTKLTNLESLTDFKAVLDEDSTLINRVLVSKQEVPDLLSQINYLAQSAGLRITKLTYSLEQNTVEANKQSIVTVSLGAEGVYTQIAGFLDSIERTARFVYVSNIRYTMDPKSQGVLGFNIILISPYLYVQSDAVTDEPVNLDIRSTEFTNFITKIKGMNFYDQIQSEIAKQRAAEEQAAAEAAAAAAQAAQQAQPQ